VTDLGLKELVKVQKLIWLDVRNTKITDAGCRKLRTAIPECYIEAGIEDQSE
jgi:hypothetical protein